MDGGDALTTELQMNIGVIGLGWWGPKLVRNLLANPHVNKVVGYDTDLSRVEAMRRDFGIEATASLGRLLEDEAIVGVVIATPPQTHYEVAQQALSAGKHVMTEKPPAMSVGELVALDALAQAGRLVHMVDATYVFSPPVVRLKELIDNGDLGPLTLVQSLRYGDNLRRDGVSRLESTMLKNGVDAIGDLVYHDIAILQYLIPGPCEVVSVNVAHNLWGHLCDTAYIDLRIGTCAAHIGLSWTLPERRRDVTLFDREKVVVFDDLIEADKLKVHGIRRPFDQPISVAASRTEPLANAVGHFVQCIRTGGPPLTGGEFMLRLMTTFEEIRRRQAALAAPASDARWEPPRPVGV